MTLNLTRRNVKGAPLTADEHDANLDKLETAITRASVRGQLSRMTSGNVVIETQGCLLYTSPSPRDLSTSRMPSSA